MVGWPAGDNPVGCSSKLFAAQAETIVDTNNKREKIFLIIKEYLAKILSWEKPLDADQDGKTVDSRTAYSSFYCLTERRALYDEKMQTNVKS